MLSFRTPRWAWLLPTSKAKDRASLRGYSESMIGFPFPPTHPNPMRKETWCLARVPSREGTHLRGKTNTYDDDVREPASAASPSEPEKPWGQTMEVITRPACEAAQKEEECQGPLPAQTRGRHQGQCSRLLPQARPPQKLELVEAGRGGRSAPDPSSFPTARPPALTPTGTGEQGRANI